MSAAPQIPGKGSPSPAKSKRSQREVARLGASIALAVLITLFAVFNFKDVKVNYVLGTGKAPLIIVIVISLLVGMVLAYVADRLPGRRKRR